MMLRVVSGLALGVLGGAPAALACTCVALPEPSDALEQADLVFEGKVAEISRVENHLVVRFRVSRAWKGNAEAVLTVRTATNGAACGYGFSPSTNYLVYAYRDSTTGVHSTNLCTRTREIKDAAPDLSVLGEGQAVNTNPEGPEQALNLTHYPNPSGRQATVSYTMPEAGRVRLCLYDLHGRRLRTLVNRVEQPGTHRALVDTAGLPGGVYVYELVIGETVARRSLVVAHE